MKALVLEGNGALTFRPAHAEPPREEGWALVRVAAAGICGSDIHRAFSGKAYHYPLIMGHEFSGVVEIAAPSGRFPAGTRVAVFPLLPCYRCRACGTGDYAQCSNYSYLGSRRDGGFAERVWVPDVNLFAVPDSVPLSHAALTEPTAVALHGIRKLRISAASNAAVFGAGPIGNLAAQWLKLHGCGRVFIVDVDPRKLAVAKQMGLEVIDASAGDAVALINEQTGGLGVDLSVEAVGLPQTFLQALQVAGMHAQVLFMGNIHGTFQVGEKDFSNVLRKELTIHGTWNSKIVPTGVDDWSSSLHFMQAGLQIDPLITTRLPLEEGPSVFAEIRDRKGLHNKVIFEIGRDA